jgi:hypothetical protein
MKLFKKKKKFIILKNNFVKNNFGINIKRKYLYNKIYKYKIKFLLLNIFII